MITRKLYAARSCIFSEYIPIAVIGEMVHSIPFTDLLTYMYADPALDFSQAATLN